MQERSLLAPSNPMWIDDEKVPGYIKTNTLVVTWVVQIH